MIPAVQKIIILVLALLQLGLPLVHAHSREEISGPGLHVPGLESLQIGSKSSEISSIQTHSTIDNFLLSVSTGIEIKPSAEDNPKFAVLAVLITAVFLFVLDKHRLVFPISNPLFNKRQRFFNRPACRAPPQSL